MALNVMFQVNENKLIKEKIVIPRLVSLQKMPFADFCDYLAQDSTVGAADVAAVMKQLTSKLPTILALNTQVEADDKGTIIRPTVSGSLTQTALNEKLKAVAKAPRAIEASDLTTADLKAGIAIDLSPKVVNAFLGVAKFKRVKAGTIDDTTSENSGTQSSVGGSSSSEGGSPTMEIEG